jgi:predicted TIM-barrel enzyme
LDLRRFLLEPSPFFVRVRIVPNGHDFQWRTEAVWVKSGNEMPMLTIRTQMDGADAAGTLFLPGLRGFAGPDLDLLAMMPVCDVNGGLADALDVLPPWPADGAAPAVGLFLLDPFLRLSDMAARLRRAGVRRVANYPTVAVLEGETARALASVGISPAGEFEALRALAADGFGIVGFATSAAAARDLAASGAGAVVLHPGADAGAREHETVAAMAAWLKPELAARGVALHLFSPRDGVARPA